MEKKEGKIPANARVDIDYSEKSPKIKFSYPKKHPLKQAEKEHSFGLHTFLILILFFFIPYFILWNYVDSWNYKEYPTECNVSLNEGYVNVTLIVNGFEDRMKIDKTTNVYEKFVKGANFTCNTGNYSVFFVREYSLFTKEPYFYPNKEINYRYFAYVLIYFFIIFPLIIFTLNKIVTKILLKNEKYCKWFPKAQAQGIIFKKKKKKYRKFKSNDLLEDIIVIPLFSNVELDYKTEGDFSKYLDKIRIREHRNGNINIKSKKIEKEKPDTYKWYAVFYFKQKPKTGYLEVIYQ